MQDRAGKAVYLVSVVQTNLLGISQSLHHLCWLILLI